MTKHLLFSVVTIGFDRQLYSVEEQAMAVEVSVLVLDGILTRDVEINILSSDGTARSESYLLFTCTTCGLCTSTTIDSIILHGINGHTGQYRGCRSNNLSLKHFL